MSDVERESETTPESLAAEMRELRAEVAGLRRVRIHTTTPAPNWALRSGAWGKW